jgi:glycosyltransferase involved in cell wall biosynthesis
MRALVLSSVFPNPKQPALGVFVRERMKRVAKECDVVVVAPVPWFPFTSFLRPQWTGIPPVEDQDGLRVLHPRFLSVPGVLKWLDGVLYAASLVPFLFRLRKRFPFDLIDAHFAYPDGMAAVLLGRVFRRPVVITLRGSIVRLSRYPLHRPQLGYALRKASRIIAVSQSLKDVALSLGTVSPEKIRVVPNGVDVSRFRPGERAAARRRLGLPPDRTVLLSVGGLNEGKGQHRVVRLLPGLLKQHPDLLYVIVGSERPIDTTRPLLNRLIAEHGLRDHVLIAGECSHDDVPLWLAAADVLCLATRSEGWANVLLEAVACARPVVATRVGGNAEVIPDDRLGLLVPADSDEALELGILAALERSWDEEVLVAHARSHSWESTARAVLDEFRRITVAPAPGPRSLAAPDLSRRGRRP